MAKEKDDDFSCEMATNGKNSFWRVDDSLGRDHGTYDRAHAADVQDRVWKENPDLEWVCMTLVPAVGATH
ncbi:hypothetical protein [Burkholderia cenocepacia]|jgi:hypothetical protein|uniref:Uncharacterized protein n=1 Tax=Burkholderia cenocepacia (strain ATCC BAA-245 / DSM 16553 / LMG 16656 / NCTC 13227 / J2315 / CF5610) TaxID=216591 RepID=B4EB64_BURCJ|nr:hypothetical protein [Burkholderia cenocepacia]KIS49338.1 hypothetical protein NP88_6974 [Burkholderia cepacia]EPZ85443.1 hypothetical protein BURCENK562V_C5930 [Burkholderia cenocepacia K56-2Valvano]ERI31670.1 hypothetical protein BURCENBC7_AP5867 [Burkholderia cenocepacia BC7]KKI79822.1 hypothetical protein WQ49_35170 [Burkholderia cenocepacia]KKI81652.1 hypothetical protein WQ49_14510 [Burkholderia cenocepacia]